MTISEYRDKCKAFIARIPRDILVIGILILASSFSFWLGYLSGQDSSKTVNISFTETPPVLDVPPVGATAGKVVASKNGTKYYLPQCSGANRISDANKIWFESVSAAVQAGYSPAANCPGI